jgi:DNA-binding protein H-NS
LTEKVFLVVAGIEAIQHRFRKGVSLMAKVARNLASMSVETLLQLRDQIGAALTQKTRELQGQLERLGMGTSTRGRGRVHPRKGIKVAPKYRGPDGEIWAGRGATPNWLAALMKQGRKREEFLIDQSAKAAAGRKRSHAKRSRRKRRQ